MASEFFTVLSIKEASNKLQVLGRNGDSIALLSEGDSELQTHTILDVSVSSDKLFISLAKSYVDQRLDTKNNDILFSFKVGTVLYFGKAIVEKIEDSSFNITVSESVYRLERRESDRLLTFPHLDIYFIFSFENVDNGSIDSNVICFDKKERIKQEKKYDKKTELLKKVKGSNWNKFSIYRSVDISMDGASVLVPGRDLDLFSVGSNVKNGWILIDEVAYEITDISVLGVAEYINSSQISDLDNKVNLLVKKFEERALSYIKRKIGVSWDRVEVCNRFSDFMAVLDDNS